MFHLLPYPASAGAAETANGAVERMVLLGLTSRIISNLGGARQREGEGTKGTKGTERTKGTGRDDAVRRRAGRRSDDVIRDLSAFGTEASSGQCRESRARHVRRPSVRRGERPRPTPRVICRRAPCRAPRGPWQGRIPTRTRRLRPPKAWPRIRRRQARPRARPSSACRRTQA